MTDAARADVSKLLPWIVTVLVAIGTGVATLRYSEDRIDKLESWQVAHATGQHADTARQMAVQEARIVALERRDAAVSASLSRIDDKLDKLTRGMVALCAASPRCNLNDSR